MSPTDDSLHSQSPGNDPASEPPADRWSRLDDVERSFATRAMRSYVAGDFATDVDWLRYLDVATDLLPLVRCGQLGIDHLHDLALACAEGRIVR